MSIGGLLSFSVTIQWVRLTRPVRLRTRLVESAYCRRSFVVRSLRRGVIIYYRPYMCTVSRVNLNDLKELQSFQHCTQCRPTKFNGSDHGKCLADSSISVNYCNQRRRFFVFSAVYL